MSQSITKGKKEKVVPGSGCCYKSCNPNDDSNDVVDLVEYHVDTLPQFQDVVNKSGEKVNFGGWLSVWMKLGEHPVICLGQDGAICKQYIFTKNMWTHKGKCRIVPKYEGYGIIVVSLTLMASSLSFLQKKINNEIKALSYNL